MNQAHQKKEDQFLLQKYLSHCTECYKPFEARLKPNQLIEQFIRKYLDPILEKKRGWGNLFKTCLDHLERAVRNNSRELAPIRTKGVELIESQRGKDKSLKDVERIVLTLEPTKIPIYEQKNTTIIDKFVPDIKEGEMPDILEVDEDWPAHL